ncbi:hypothetical protein P3X46_029552 [Hevea brasiliensis]|uniref:TCP domain-containing protein n=1 Tax=Hevea brasiliensis TaxID=3981 RepID=A0ABQ9KUA0_HEVBR|nr:transcription factor CYCLOIDEA [Hevea brasiliensis]KAJ9147381.1 hypothetical protein P3X46_029552 [Hevea brasiliensis]
MFPSTNSISPFPHLSSSFYDLSPYIIDHEANDLFLQHHHPLTVPSLPVTETLLQTPASNNAMISNIKQDINVGFSGNQHDPHVFLPGKKPVKKDRHSKIYTAQGLRDRRVRLSIEIARKFFDLQDMLGFDKASKTLEWLLSKSKKAIKEVAQNGGAKSLCSTSACEVASENGEQKGIVLKSESLAGRVCNEKKTKRLQKAASSNLVAKESRAKARARARERTRVKMCTRRFHESKHPDPTSSNNYLSRSTLTQQHQACDKSHNGLKVVALPHHDQVEQPDSHSSLANLVPKGNIIEESIVIKRKLKPSTMTDYQQNLVMLKEVTCNNSNLPNLPQNWDINSAIARSSFCAITNVNRSKGLHLYG